MNNQTNYKQKNNVKRNTNRQLCQTCVNKCIFMKEKDEKKDINKCSCRNCNEKEYMYGYCKQHLLQIDL